MALFEVSADDYQRFMGRFSDPLARPFADLGLVGVGPGEPVLDVGCGPGVLTRELARRQGAGRVAAVDPVDTFVRATRASIPGVDARRAAAEDLPFGDDSFAATLAQLVVHFMKEPARGLAEMVRVTRPGGRVSACVWDHAGGTGPLAAFWQVARRQDPDVVDEGGLVGSTAGQLEALLVDAGLRQVEERPLTISVDIGTFADWWDPFTLGVGPAGQHVAGLDADARAQLERMLRAELGAGPFTLRATAWAATGLR